MSISILPWGEMLGRLALAVVLGSLIGWNREKAQKPAGMKTHMLVCLGSALIMMVSVDIFLRYVGQSHSIDPGRIAAQVVTGIGFLGAGTIIHAEGGLVHGLTTAASIWTTAGIGLACGAGFYFLAVAAALLAVGGLALMNRFFFAAKKKTSKKE